MDMHVNDLDNNDCDRSDLNRITNIQRGSKGKV